MASTEADTSLGVQWRALAAPEEAECYDNGDTLTREIKTGWRKEPGFAAFQADTLWEKDVKIAMRDGVNIRTDIFRPADSDRNPVPALIAWSPYGKSGRGEFDPAASEFFGARRTDICTISGYFRLDMVPGRVGIPRSRLSGFEKFEAPDPAEWTARGYAIINPDSRGAFDSEGNLLCVA
jgi:predicted acyl esterase